MPLTAHRRAAVIAVFGMLASDFSIVVSAPSTEVRLALGEPRRFASGAEETGSAEGAWQAHFLSVEVPSERPLHLTLTTLTATPNLNDLVLTLWPRRNSGQWNGSRGHC